MTGEQLPHHRILNSLRLCQETVLPPVMGKLLHEAMQPDPDLQRIAEIIKLDPSLTATILALANSPYYKLTSPVSDIQRAVVVLGNKEISKIVLGVSFQNHIQAKSTQNADFTEMWSSILWSATASEILARHLDSSSTSHAYLCALLKDLSRILLATSGELPFPIKDLPTFSPEQAAIERKQWGTTHQYLTTELMDQWSLPKMCTESILAHHDMEHLDQHPPLVQAVILGTRWAEVEFHHKGAAEPALQFHALAQKVLNLTDEHYAALRQEVADRFRSICETLNISMASTNQHFFDYPIPSLQQFYFVSMDIQTAQGGLEAVAQVIAMHVKLYWDLEDWDLALHSPFSQKWAFFHNLRQNNTCVEIPEDQPIPWKHGGPIIDLWDNGHKIGSFRLCSQDGARLSSNLEIDLYFRFAGQNYALYLQRHAVMESKALMLDSIPIGVA
ncbi:MAG: HDOD domain-containing protein, partial [Desulfoplanes sp.]